MKTTGWKMVFFGSFHQLISKSGVSFASSMYKVESAGPAFFFFFNYFKLNSPSKEEESVSIFSLKFFEVFLFHWIGGLDRIWQKKNQFLILGLDSAIKKLMRSHLFLSCYSLQQTIGLHNTQSGPLHVQSAWSLSRNCCCDGATLLSWALLNFFQSLWNVLLSINVSLLKFLLVCTY